MNEVIPLNPTPKMESYPYEGQRYILKFEPNAPPEKRWSWCVIFTRAYTYFGNASTIDLAGRQARAMIHRVARREA